MSDGGQMLGADGDRSDVVVRLSRLQAITSALSGARTPSEVVQVVLGEGMAAVGASAAAAAVLDASGDHLHVVGAIGYRSDILDPLRRFSIDAPLPLAEAVRRREPRWYRSEDELRGAYPKLAAMVQSGHRAWAAIPLMVEDRLVGAISLSFAEPKPFDDGDRAFLSAIAAQCAQALERARLYDAEASARAAAEEAGERLGFLAEASAVLNSSLDVNATLSRLAELAVPRLADWCAVHLVDAQGDPRPLIATHADPERAALVRDLLQRFPVRLDAPDGLGQVLSTGRSAFYPEITDELLDQAAAADPERLEMARRIGFGSAMIVPLAARGRILGAISLINERERRAAPADLTLAEELAARAAAALDNARLFEERSRVARSLQASLLPPILPDLPGLELGARYVAAGAGTEVGGDFYDVFAVSRDRWLLVVGDVCGRGADAAGVTGLARHVVRAAAIDRSQPSEILRHLNDVLLRSQEELSAGALTTRFCTACVVAVTPGATGGAHLTICSAGHPLPLIRRADATIEEVGKPGSLIGVLDDPDLVDVEAELAPGDAFVCFTDGVTERRQAGEYFEDRLTSLLAEGGARGAEAIAEQIQRAAQAFGPTEPGDDMAVLVLGVPAGDEPALQSAHLSLVSDVGSPAAARRFVQETLTDWGAPPELIEEGMLVISELVTNSVLHAHTDIGIELESRGEVVRVAVTDHARSLPALRAYSYEALTGRGLEVVTAMAWRWAVESLPTGKQVWADLRLDGARPGRPRADTSSAATARARPAAGPALERDDRQTIVYLQVPVAGYLELMERNDSVLREIELLGIRAREGEPSSVPEHLLVAVMRAVGGFRSQRDGFREAVQEAAARGETQIDLEGAHAPDAGEGVLGYVRMLEEADEYCREQGLCGSAPKRVTILRRWFAEETVAQLEGRAPHPPPELD
ncbi:MAG TPA: SpoIIE family protein phosphatase [Egibacteraceae bacterium]|nr:SpoIIE family protein phosphatase [Egibacteraceae bacterium]